MNLTPKNPLIEGVEVTLSNRATVVVAPFNIRRTRETGNDRVTLRQSAHADSAEAMAAMLHIAGTALRANYPHLTDAELDEECNPKDLSAILVALGKANAGDDAPGKTSSPTTNGPTSDQPSGTDSLQSSA